MTFFDIYREELANAVREHPDEYGFPLAAVPTVANKMIAAMQRGSYNKDGRAFKAACRRLGIKHTYAAIDAAIKQSS